MPKTFKLCSNRKIAAIYWTLDGSDIGIDIDINSSVSIKDGQGNNIFAPRPMSYFTNVQQCIPGWSRLEGFAMYVFNGEYNNITVRVDDVKELHMIEDDTFWSCHEAADKMIKALGLTKTSSLHGVHQL